MGFIYRVTNLTVKEVKIMPKEKFVLCKNMNM